MFKELDQKIKENFPKVSIKFKNESLFMKIIGFVLFFNRNFMKTYITTVRNTIYFPSKESLEKDNLLNVTVYLHELVHIIDNQNNFLFGLLYMVPQILFFILFIISLFISWKLVLLSFLFLLPIPAYFRMKYEKRAYTISLYVMHKLNLKYNVEIFNLQEEADFIFKHFNGLAYYFMWPFKSLNEYFLNAAKEISENKRPKFVEEEIYDTIDKLLIG